MNESENEYKYEEEIAAIDEMTPETEPEAAAESVPEPAAAIMDMATAMRTTEAILFASPEPLAFAAVREQLGSGVDAVEVLDRLREDYAERGINLMETGGMWSFRTAPDLAQRLTIKRQPRRKLPRAAAEVLAIIGYHQPVTRGEIESIRGVDTGRGTLDILLELGWIRPGKRRETPGRPLTWITTPAFLSHFNLASLKDLPGMDDLKAAGLLDTRPVLADLPKEKTEDGESILDAEASSYDDFADWSSKEGETAA